MAIIDQEGYKNGLLARLSREDSNLLGLYLELINLSLSAVLAGPGEAIDYLYFPTSGVVSVHAKTLDGTFLEVGIYGREGAGPAPLILGQQRTADRHVVQASGQALRTTRAAFVEALAQSTTLRDLLIRYVDVFMTQVGQTALSHRDPHLRKRLARCILMIDDRVDDHRIEFAPATLAAVLGFPADEVVAAILALQRDRLVEESAGGLILLDRERLSAAAGTSYGLPEAEYLRLLGPVGVPHRTGPRP